MLTPALQLVSSARPAGLGCGSLTSSRAAARTGPRGAVVVRCAQDPTSERSLREKAAVLFTGFAASTCMALNPGVALAEPAAAPAPAKPAEVESKKDGPAKAEAKGEEAKPSTPAASAAAKPTPPSPPPPSPQAILEKKKAEAKAEAEKDAAEVQKLMQELEKSKAAAIKSVDQLQARLSDEHSLVIKLKADLRASKAEVEKDSAEILKLKAEVKSTKAEVDKESEEIKRLKKQAEDLKKDVENERKALATAKEQAQAQAQALAAAALEGARSTQMVIYGIAAVGWLTAAGVFLSKKQSTSDDDLDRIPQIDWKSLDGADDVLAAREQARAESESLRRELSTVKGALSLVTTQLEQERSQSKDLRDAISSLEGDFALMESKMLAAKSEAFEFQRKLDDFSVKRSSSPSPSASASSSPAPAPPAAKSVPSSMASNISPTRTSFTSSIPGKLVKVKFSLQQELPFGQSMMLVGSHPALGQWDESKGPQMTWSEGHIWKTEVALPSGTALEFKCVRKNPDGSSQWEDGANHVLLVPASGTSTMGVKVEWGAGMEVLKESASSSNGNGSSNGSSSTSAAVAAAVAAAAVKKEEVKKEQEKKEKELAGAAAKKAGGNKWKGLLG